MFINHLSWQDLCQESAPFREASKMTAGQGLRTNLAEQAWNVTGLTVGLAAPVNPRAPPTNKELALERRRHE